MLDPRLSLSFFLILGIAELLCAVYHAYIYRTMYYMHVCLWVLVCLPLCVSVWVCTCTSIPCTGCIVPALNNLRTKCQLDAGGSQASMNVACHLHACARSTSACVGWYVPECVSLGNAITLLSHAIIVMESSECCTCMVNYTSV